MTPTGWEQGLSDAGSVASFLGLIASGFAWRAASNAKKAAEEAKRAVQKQDTAHEFAKLATDAKDLLAAVQSQRADRAIEAINDLVHLLSVATERRSMFLADNAELKVALKQLNAVSNYLSSRGFPKDPPELEKLTDRCQQIHQIVCRVQGSLEKSLEGANS